MTQVPLVDPRRAFRSAANNAYGNALRTVRENAGYTGVEIDGSRDEGARQGYFETPLKDGTLGFFMRRSDDCLQAAVASCTQIPPHFAPDLRIDDRLASGVDPEQLARENWQQLARWATQYGLRGGNSLGRTEVRAPLDRRYPRQRVAVRRPLSGDVPPRVPA